MNNIRVRLNRIFLPLRNQVFARLYLAQTVSLLGDAFTWVGLALLSYQFGKERSAVILATALTIRVSTFVVFSPFAGVLADKVDRKKILYVTHFCRMAIVGCLPFVKEEWQIYGLVFLLNFFNAFFTPTYRAVIPQIINKDVYRQSVGLSTATFQLLGVIGPGIAGILAIWFGARNIFLIDSFSFVLAGIIILTIPAKEVALPISEKGKKIDVSFWSGAGSGIRLLFGNKLIRFALSIEFVSALAGAQILVNTIGFVEAELKLNDAHYGSLMAAFGAGAAIAAFVAGYLDKSRSRSMSLILGCLILGTAVTLAIFVNYQMMLVLWLAAGIGQTLAEMPSETMIGEHIEMRDQGKVFGAHFAFSHLWWAIAYPIAGFLGTRYAGRTFFLGGLMTLAALVAAVVVFKPRSSAAIDK